MTRYLEALAALLPIIPVVLLAVGIGVVVWLVIDRPWRGRSFAALALIMWRGKRR